MNVLVRELKINAKSFGLWLAGMLFLAVASVGKMSGMVGENSAALNAMLMLLPPSLRSLFGMGSVDFTQPIGIFAVIALYLALVAALHASSLGASTFAREERDKTFEFLYVKGRSRARILLAKLLACLIQLFSLNALVYCASALITRLALGASIWAPLLPIMAGIGVMQALFFAAGLLLSLLTRRMPLAGALASGLVMTLFLAALFSDLVGAQALARVTPFKLFDGKVILNAGINAKAAVLCLAVTAALIALSLILHNRRDLNG